MANQSLQQAGAPTVELRVREDSGGVEFMPKAEDIQQLRDKAAAANRNDPSRAAKYDEWARFLESHLIDDTDSSKILNHVVSYDHFSMAQDVEAAAQQILGGKVPGKVAASQQTPGGQNPGGVAAQQTPAGQDSSGVKGASSRPRWRRRTMAAKHPFGVARELIKHEEGLVNIRAGWFLVVQGFLFTSFVIGVGLLKDLKGAPAAPYISAVLVLLGLLGVYLSVVVFNEVRVAFHRIKNVEEWWEKKESKGDFPPVVGKVAGGWLFRSFSVFGAPFVFGVVWIGLIIVLLLWMRPS
jgi:hypothetical protein